MSDAPEKPADDSDRSRFALSDPNEIRVLPAPEGDYQPEGEWEDAEQDDVREALLRECGGEGGKPGPCPEGGADDTSSGKDRKKPDVPARAKK